MTNVQPIESESSCSPTSSGCKPTSGASLNARAVDQSLCKTQRNLRAGRDLCPGLRVTVTA